MSPLAVKSFAQQFYNSPTHAECFFPCNLTLNIFKNIKETPSPVVLDRQPIFSERGKLPALAFGRSGHFLHGNRARRFSCR